MIDKASCLCLGVSVGGVGVGVGMGVGCLHELKQSQKQVLSCASRMLSALSHFVMWKGHGISQKKD